jgi:hypothetical protein
MNISRRMSVAGTVAAAVLLGGSAYAYFTSSATGTAATTVGTASTWAVTGSGGTGSPAATGGPMYPGVGTMTVTYAAKNPAGGGTQHLNAAAVTVSADGSGNVLDTNAANAPKVGCLASWFTVGNGGAPAPVDVASGSSVDGSATVQMTNAAVSQDLCQGVKPQVTISVS